MGTAHKVLFVSTAKIHILFASFQDASKTTIMFLTEIIIINTSYIPAGQGAPKAWKRWGSSDGASKKCPSVVTITCLVFATMGVCPGLHQYQHPS